MIIYIHHHYRTSLRYHTNYHVWIHNSTLISANLYNLVTRNTTLNAHSPIHTVYISMIISITNICVAILYVLLHQHTRERTRGCVSINAPFNQYYMYS